MFHFYSFFSLLLLYFIFSFDCTVFSGVPLFPAAVAGMLVFTANAILKCKLLQYK